MISIQESDFNVGEEYQKLATQDNAGAVVTFVGKVRPFSETHSKSPEAMWLEHYPGMTEKVLQNIEQQAASRWPLIATSIIHRIGKLYPGDQIVFVGVSSKHRKAAFEASQYIMDILKTEAPFWKKEGDQWVDAKDSDTEAAQYWQ